MCVEFFFFFKQNTAYDMRISDWSSDVCSSDLTAGIRIAGMAKAFNKPLSHGNGAGPHNIALQAGLANGSLVEYHFHKWMAYNAIFKNVPHPVDGYLEVSQDRKSVVCGRSVSGSVNLGGFCIIKKQRSKNNTQQIKT